MKKLLLRIAVLFFSLALAFMPLIASASSATSYTYAIDAKGRYVRTQDAYLPDRTVTHLYLNKPEDIFIDNKDFLYIADTGNKRIVKYNPSTDKIVMEITHELIQNPTGIYVTENGDIYVADIASSHVIKFSEDGEFIEAIGRPSSPAFGTNDFNPMKIAVDEAGNMYILGEGIYDGIIQLARTGEFLGYFASNKVNLTFVQRLQDIFFTEEQKRNLLGRTPITFSNVFVDRAGLVYSTTNGQDVLQAVKKHNTSGKSMFEEEIIASEDLIDLFVDANGIIYAVGQAGLIFIYSAEGEFIYSFGAFNSMQDVSGLFSSLSSIAVDSKGTVWTCDRDKSILQSFTQTEYARLIYQALNEYSQGNYKGSIALWSEILKLNQMSILAHNNIGKNLLFEQRYEEAMYHTRIAGNRFYYSQAYWEIRNIWLQKNLAYIFLILILIYVVSKIIKWADKKWNVLEWIKKPVRKIYNLKPVKDTLYLFRFFKHPIDSFYELKAGNKGSSLGATIIYFVMFVVYIVSLTSKGFIYQKVAPEDIDYQSITLGYFAISMLFVVCNYLVTSINDGEGKLIHIYKMLPYSMGPAMMSLIIVTIASHFLTHNEVFFLQITNLAGIVWSGLLILLGVQEIHSYTTRDAIKSILFTLLFMLIIAVMLLIIIIMGEQLYQFLESVIKEVIRNVTA
ncbi:MAG: hypothetical protein GXX10_00625 [Clostridiaceae bacterium]|nr:hypothetical protein [Clostridiaceae bacterium]